jgi:DNA polymerase III delta prime subunit
VFENIIGQDKATSLLRSELENRALPGSLLIHGEPFSGKLSTALEIARILSCTEDAAWSCRCRSCGLHRVLAHPGTLLLGSRSFGAEIAASADVLRRLRNTASRYLFVRAVRKLLRRCDAHLWEGADARMRSAFAVGAEIEESLAVVEPGGSLPEGPALERLLDTVSEKARHVAAALPRDNTPIGVVRKATYWVRLSSSAQARTIVIENADRMVDASRNSLLKLLEEPPEKLHIILLTTNVRAVIPTILSRVRRYRLEARDEKSSREVLARVFRADPAFNSLAAYFLSWEKVSGDQTGGLADLFLAAASSRAQDERPVLALYDKCQKESALDTGAYFREFARVLVERMRVRWKAGGGGGQASIEEWNRIVQDAAAEQALMSLQPALVLQSTLYRMRDVAA